MAKFGRALKLLLMVVVIAVALYLAVPLLATWAQSGSFTSAVAAAKAPSTFWRTLI